MAELIGQGIYSVPEAARLTGIAAPSIRRWLFGYTARDGERHSARRPGLWTPAFADEGERALSFHDLIELRFVDAFRAHGVSLQAIRVAARHAREMFGTDHPLTCRRFQTDGRSVFATVAKELEGTGEEESLIDLVKKQWVFKEVVASALYSGIEYDPSGTNALRWFPVPRSRSVVLDPARAFGKPILDRFRVPTDTLYQAFKVEKDIRRVANLYEIPAEAVGAAVRFEERLAGREGTH
jgi:uncharacterized protein (DUF433 family)/DNA-binding transcriptional MerR regulator